MPRNDDQNTEEPVKQKEDQPRIYWFGKLPPGYDVEAEQTDATAD